MQYGCLMRLVFSLLIAIALAATAVVFIGHAVSGLEERIDVSR